MSLNQLLKLLRREYPKMRFYRNKIWNKEVIRSNFGINRFMMIRILANGQYRIDTTDMERLGMHGLSPNYDVLKQTISDLVRVTNPELIGGGRNV